MFVYLEKTYDWLPGEELWYCMRRRSGGTLVKDMYEDSKTVMRCAIGMTDDRGFKLGMGVHASFSISHQCNMENEKILDLSISLIQKKHFIGQYRRKNIFVLIQIGGGGVLLPFFVTESVSLYYICYSSTHSCAVLHVYLRFVSSSFC